MTEHTPGPWEINPGCDWVIESQDGVSISSAYTPAGQREVRQANARFIAAAPDMEEALVDLLREYDRLMTRAGVANSAYFRGFASGAHAALAKAKGRTE